MKEFEVNFYGFLTVEADTREQAVDKFRTLYPTPAVQPDKVTELGSGHILDTHEVIGICEDCEQPIYHDEEFHEGDGIMIHARCHTDDDEETTVSSPDQ